MTCAKLKCFGEILCIICGVLTTIAVQTQLQGLTLIWNAPWGSSTFCKWAYLEWHTVCIVMLGDKISFTSKITIAARSAKVQIDNPLTIFTKNQEDYIRQQSQAKNEDHVEVKKTEEKWTSFLMENWVWLCRRDKITPFWGETIKPSEEHKSSIFTASL